MGSESRLLGIDLGGTKTVVALALGDRIAASQRFPTRPSGRPERDIEAIVAACRRLLADAGVAPADVDCVGVSAPGPMDSAREYVVGPPNLAGWDRVPLRALLEDALGRPVAMENDANAMVLAEWRHGAGRGFRDVAAITMSTGVGVGLILGGRLHRGETGNAGEFGHSTLEFDGEPCSCGLRGCVEAYVGGAAWTRRLRALAPPDSFASRLAGGRDALRPEHVVAAAREGDTFATDEMERFNHYLARAVTNLVFALAPQVVVLGTIPTAAGEALCLEPVRARVAERTWSELVAQLRICGSELGDRRAELAGVSVAREALSGGAQGRSAGVDGSIVA